MFFLLSACLSAQTLNTPSALPSANFTANPTSGCSPLLVNFTDASAGNPTSWRWDLGNGTISFLQNPAVTYFNPGQYNIKLVVTNATGSDSIVKTQYITVNASPVVSFIGTPLTGCFPLPVQFTDASLAGGGNIVSREWDFGDGNTSTAQNPQNIYTGGGNYNVSLRIKNSLGCVTTVTKPGYVQINTGVHADFTNSIPNSCNPPVTINFINNSSGTGLLTYQWDFGDGGTSNVAAPSHNYTAVGSYTVRLIVTNSIGCTDTFTKVNAIVLGGVQANFTMPQNVCVGRNVNITNTSNPLSGSVFWDFGDGTSSTVSNPVKVYTAAGNYVVKLVANFGGCIDSILKPITVLNRPSINFSADKTGACTSPLTVTFTPNVPGAVSYLWKFGDGSTSTVANPTHTYNALGSFDITLIVSNAGGCSDTLTKPGYILIQAPQVTLPGLPQLGCAPFNYTFTANVNSLEPVVSYLWNFGDGSTSTLATPSHTFNAGTYTITVVITTASGCTAGATISSGVRVGLPPVVNFSANPTDVCAYLPVNFTDLSTGSVDQWLWDFGDGGISFSQNPSHTYSDTGYFDVMLTVWNNGCSQAITFPRYIYIKPPIAAFGFLTSCSSQNQIDFIDKSIGADTWAWDFADGSTSTLQNPSHTFAASGIYNVKLTVTNTLTGCSYTIVNIITILNEHADFIATDTAICKGAFANFHTQNLNPANILSYSWRFGDGSTLTETTGTVQHRYNVTGRYTVSLTIVDIHGCTDSIVKPLYISADGPTALFGNGGAGNCSIDPVVFIDSSFTDGIHSIQKWVWNYGDGIIDTLIAPPFQHTYNASGDYSISLKVIDSRGCTDTYIRQGFISIFKPLAAFSTNDTVSCPGKPIRFANNSTGINLTCLWNFGDGTTSSQSAPVHQYSADGTYTVSLNIIDEHGCTDFLIKTVYIKIISPVADFLMSDSLSTCPPLVVTFTNKSINQASIIWDFGDGTTSTLDAPTHFYSTPGIFDVKLSVTGKGGCVDVKIKRIIVRGPKGSLSYTNIAGCNPLQTNFKASTKDDVSFIWDFNDGTTIVSRDSIVSHIYTNPGEYLPKLILVDPNGCQVPIVGLDSISVYGVIADFTIDKNLLCDSGFIYFTNTSVNNDPITIFMWNFGDGTTSSLENPVHRYTSTGIYNTQLIITTSFGCKDTALASPFVKIVSSPKIAIAGDTAICVPAFATFTGQLLVPDTSAISWKWKFGNGNTSTLKNPPRQLYPFAGAYNIQAIAANSSGCKDTVNKVFQANPLPVVTATNDTWVCKGQSINLIANGAVNYTWSPGIGLSCLNCASPVAMPDTTRNYIVTGQNIFGCAAKDTVLLSVKFPFIMTVPPPANLCLGKAARLVAAGADNYIWSPVTGLSNATIANPITRTDQTITYMVIGTDDKGCFKDTGYVPITVYPIPLVTAPPDKTINIGQSVSLVPALSQDVTGIVWTPSHGITASAYPGITVKPSETTTYTIEVTNAGGCRAKDDVTILVICDNANVFIPNTFSPNNDGANDIFYVRGSGVFKIKTIRIFSRWGELIFEKNNLNPNDASTGWDGTFKGKKLTPDVFVYTVDVICDNNTILTHKGNVALIQ